MISFINFCLQDIVLSRLASPVPIITDQGTLALCLYDYLLTLSCEVELMWKGRLRISTGLYFTTKYLLVGQFIFMIAASDTTPQVFFFNTFM
jgi:hypothetical protein